MQWEPTLRAYTKALKRLEADTLPSIELKRTVAVLTTLYPVVYVPLPTVREEALRTKLLIKAFDEILLAPPVKAKE